MDKSKKSSIENFNKPFAKALRDLLDGINSPLDRKVSQKELADNIGVSRQVISQYCNGDTSPNVERLKTIAEFFNTSSDFLIGLISIPSINMEDKDIHEKTGLSDLAIKALKKQKFIIDNIYEDKEDHLFSELQSINMLIEDMGYADEDNPKTSFINLFTKYRMFLSNETSDLCYMTDYKGNIEPLKVIKTSNFGAFVSSDKLPFKASMLENMFLMAIQDRLKELKKEGELDGNHNTKKE